MSTCKHLSEEMRCYRCNDELIASLQARIAALDGENVTMRKSLHEIDDMGHRIVVQSYLVRDLVKDTLSRCQNSAKLAEQAKQKDAVIEAARNFDTTVMPTGEIWFAFRDSLRAALAALDALLGDGDLRDSTRKDDK